MHFSVGWIKYAKLGKNHNKNKNQKTDAVGIFNIKYLYNLVFVARMHTNDTIRIFKVKT